MQGHAWGIVIAALAAACGSARSEAPVPATAARAAPANRAAPAAPAPGAAAETAISSTGVGPLGAGLPDDAEAIGKLLPGLTVTRYDNVAEDHEVHEYTVKQGERRVLLLFLDLYRSGPDKVFRIAVFDPMFATASGIGVGSTIGALAAKHPDVTCRFERYDPDGDIYRVDRRLYCESRSLPNLAFDVDPAGYRAPPGPIPAARLAGREIHEIGWLNPTGGR